MNKIKQKIKKWMMVGLSGAIALAMGSVAFAQEMVKDPSTGKMIKAPQYGGQFVWSSGQEPPHADTWFGSSMIRIISPTVEKLGMVDWAIDRDKWDLTSGYTPLDVVKPHLAESYETPDPLTIIFHLRKGVRWQNKPPMNGRELTADDIVVNFHRITGLGSGFTEPSPHAVNVSGIKFESITAPEKYTVVFKLKKIDFNALIMLYWESHEGGWIYPPEVIKEHGDAKDWRNIVGTGPYMLTDWVEGSSVTWTKNPDYWKDDEKFPGNRLPYADELKMLFIQDSATKLAAFRSGKLAVLRNLGVDDAENLQRANPELVMTSSLYATKGSVAFDVRKPPFSDIRVRRAMQLAIDTETLNRALYRGLGDTTPLGIVGAACIGFYVPYEEWPDQLKADYGYDPARAKKLLAEAGYPDGFKTTLYYSDFRGSDVEYTQASKDYWAKIGVDVEIKMMDLTTLISHMHGAHTYEGMVFGERGTDYNPLLFVRIKAYSDAPYNKTGNRDPEYDAIVDAAEATTDYKEMQRLVRKADMYYIKQHWDTWGPRPPAYHFHQPWLGSYNGEYTLGGGQTWTMYARLWIDQELKESMGH